VPTPGGDAAVLLYHDAEGRSATLLVVRVEARDHAARRLTAAPVATLYRVRGGIGYALTLPAAALDDRLATALAGS
jgi:hypothetical protein